MQAGTRLLLRSASGLLAALASGAAQATLVMVISLNTDRADLVINNSSVRVLRPGETSPEGVRLVSATPASALLEVDGKRYALRLGESTAAVTTLNVDARGQFVANVAINGRDTRALVDTGATTVAINRDEARRLGVVWDAAKQVKVLTAGGTRAAYPALLASVSVGNIVISNVQALVLDGGAEQLPIILLGMSFLSGLDMQRSGDILTLTQKR